MSKWLKPLLIVGILWLGIASVWRLAPAIPGDLWTKLVAVKELAEKEEVLTYSYANINEIYLESLNGNIGVTGSEDCSEIIVKARYQVRGSNKKDAEVKLASLSTEIKEEVGGRLFVRGIYNNQKSNTSIHYDLIVPYQLAVQVKTENGRIDCQNLAGRLILNGTNGSVNIYSEKGPQELFVRTSNGNIVLKTSFMGKDYELKTTNGSIKMYLPPELGINITAKTTNGRVALGTSEWLVSGNNLGKRYVEAQRGDGSLELRVTTTNGNISLFDLD